MPPQYHQLAALFDEMSELYSATDFEESDKYRARAYANAAINIRDWLARGDDVRPARLAGARIEEKIAEWERTGTIADAEELRRRAAALGQFSRILGIGPAAARDLAARYGTLAELRRAMAKGTSGLTLTQRLGVRYYDDLQRRIPRSTATRIGATIIELIAAVLPRPRSSKVRVTSVAPPILAGSFRRGLATVGDLDIIVTAPPAPKLSEAIAAAVAQSPSFVAMILCGSAKISMLWSGHANGWPHVLRVDIIITPASAAASALLYFTGSREFNVALRALAKRRGYTLNEHGLWRGARRLSTPTEKSIFDELEVEYVEPAERRGAADVRSIE